MQIEDIRFRQLHSRGCFAGLDASSQLRITTAILQMLLVEAVQHVKLSARQPTGSISTEAKYDSGLELSSPALDNV